VAISLVRIEDTDQSRFVPGAEHTYLIAWNGVALRQMKVRFMAGNMALIARAKERAFTANMLNNW